MGESVNVMRKWVFPILRLLVVAAIAVALVKLAFFADTAEALDPAQPTGQIGRASCRERVSRSV